MSPSTCPLLSLSTELSLAIISYLPNPALITLAQTCSKMQTLAESQLYKKICVRDGHAVKRLAQDLEQPPERVLAVEHLEVTPGKYGWLGIERMPQLAGRMERLRRLKVESPLINMAGSHEWWTEGCVREYMELFDVGAWRNLTSFTLHSHGTHDRYYNVKSVLPVFLSPTLQYLHLSCVDISCANESFAALGAPSMQTPLETLILERCTEQSYNLGELHAILRHPRALRSFTLLLDVSFGQSKDPCNASRLSRAQILGLLEALQQQSDSLRYLRYTHRPISGFSPGSPEYFSNSTASSVSTIHHSGLSPFKRLHALDVGYGTNLAMLLLNASLAPPNLLTLGLSGITLDYSYGHTWDHLAAFIPAISATTNFSHLTLHTVPSCSCGHLDGMSWQFKYNSHLQAWPASGARLLAIVENLQGKASVELVGARYPPVIAPPFLHGQSLTKEHVVFDSRKDCREGHDRRFKQETYIPDCASGWSGPFSALGNANWTG